TSTRRSRGRRTTGWEWRRPGWSRPAATSPATSARRASGSTWWRPGRCGRWPRGRSPASRSSRTCGSSAHRWAGTSTTPTPPRGPASRCCPTGSRRLPGRSSTPTGECTPPAPDADTFVGMTDLQTIRVHGRDVCFRRAGSGPTLVLVHGIAGDGGERAPVTDRLAESFDVITPDLPGHGASTRLRGDHSIGAFATWLRDLLEALDVER